MEKKTAVIINANDGVNYHRLLAPYSQIDGVQFIAGDIGTLMETDFTQFDNIVINRSITLHSLTNNAFLTTFKELKCKLIMDIDDSWYYPKSHHLYTQAKEIEKIVLYNLKRADVITTTTPALQQLIKDKTGRDSILVKNAINPKASQFSLEKNIHDYNRVSFIGGEQHRKYCPEGVEFITGYNPQSYGAAYWDKGIIIVNLPYSQFNSYKSELKLIEAGHFSKAVICTDVEAYKVFSGTDQCIKTDPLLFYHYIKFLKKEIEYQDFIRKNLNEFIKKNYNFEIENEKRINLLK